MKRIFLNVVIIFSLVACSSSSKNRYREGNNIGQEAGITVQEEEAMTREYLPQIKKEYPAVNDPILQRYISNLGKKLVIESKLEGNPYHYTFELVDAKMPNAFALPAGTVYVTTPLIAMASNEAELAGVIGHEVGHIIARHTAERMYQQKKNQSKNLLYTIGGAVLGGAAGYGIGSKLCKKSDKKCLAQATLAGGVVGGGSALLIQKFTFMANSREDELEADRIGFRIATKAGYSKDHVGNFFEKLLIMEKQAQGGSNALTRSFSDAMSTHPPSEQRVKQMREMASQMTLPPGVIVNTTTFNEMKQRL